MKRLSQEKKMRNLDFEMTDLYVKDEPIIYTAFRKSSMSDQEQEGVDHMLEMMMASKQQILLRKAMRHGKE